MLFFHHSTSPKGSGGANAKATASDMTPIRSSASSQGQADRYEQSPGVRTTATIQDSSPGSPGDVPSHHGNSPDMTGRHTDASMDSLVANRGSLVNQAREERAAAAERRKSASEISRASSGEDESIGSLFVNNSDRHEAPNETYAESRGSGWQEAAELSARERCLPDVQKPLPSFVPRDRPVLFVDLEGVLLNSFPRSSLGGQQSKRVLPVTLGIQREEMLLYLRPRAMGFLSMLKWEAGVAVAVYTRDGRDDAVTKVEALESKMSGFFFDFVVHSGTQGAWDDGRHKSLRRVMGPDHALDAFLLDASAEDVGVQERSSRTSVGSQASSSSQQVLNAALVPQFGPFAVDAEGSIARLSINAGEDPQEEFVEQVFEKLETECAVLRKWLLNVTVGHTTFRERLQQADGRGDEGEADGRGDDGEDVQRAKSSMLMHGIDLQKETAQRPAEEAAEGRVSPLAALGAALEQDFGASNSGPLESPRSLTASQGLPTKRPSGIGKLLGRSISGGKSADDLGTASNTSSYSYNSRGARVRSSVKRAISRLSSKRNVVKPPNFHGAWVCIGTWGLDDFLRECGIGKMQRIAASKAPWPSWEFRQDGNKLAFINHSFLGPIEEEFEVGGPEYTAVDGKKQTLQCRAVWEGETLVIHRCGPQGKFVEKRHIDAEGHLHFSLEGVDKGAGCSWGRSFRRK